MKLKSAAPLVISTLVFGLSCSQKLPPSRPNDRPVDRAARELPESESPTVLDGLWSGSWGGGESGGVVYQPVVAHLAFEGTVVDLENFPGMQSLNGSFVFNRDRQTVALSARGSAESEPPEHIITLQYLPDRDVLSLAGAAGRSLVLHRETATGAVPGNLQLELLEATGINERGDLQVNDVARVSHRVFQKAHYRRLPRVVALAEATIVRVNGSDVSEVGIETARQQLVQPQPVALMFRVEGELREPAAPGQTAAQLPSVDEAVRSMLSRSLAPGTLVFLLPPQARIPQP